MKPSAFVSVAAMTLAAGLQLRADPPSHARLQAVPFTQVQIQDEFWLPRIETNRKVTLPHNIKLCEDTKRIDNFAVAGKKKEGKFEGIYYNDSDVYKVIEGAAYTLALHPDKELEAKTDEIIDLIASAQQPDGYLNTYYTLVEPSKRWTDLPAKHELYCAGHMFEAAVAYFQATGKRKFLEVSCRLADHIDDVFGPGKLIGYSGHEEIELALIKLYRATGNEKYRKLAEWFVAIRGQERNPKEEYRQAHLPVKEQSEIVGHAVRAMYLYSGVADIAAMTGDQGYSDAMERLWQNVTGRKMYLTGGIGAEARNEGFSADFDLPNDSAYAETCAAIGMCYWNHRLLLLHADGRFTDILERVMYNGALSGVSLGGDRFFYVNPLASRGGHHRQAWFGTACCPSNVVRWLPSLGGYIYAQNDKGVWVNLYVASTAKMTLAGNELKLVQETQYPWSGQVKIKLETAKPGSFSMNLHIPAWCEAFAVSVNGGEIAGAKPEKGYLPLSREFKSGDVIDLNLAMPARRVESDPRIKGNVGRVAIERGPLVYCLEGTDNAGRVRNLALPREAKLTEKLEPELLNGVVVITADGLTASRADWGGALYGKAGEARKAKLTAVPYCAWDNREPGEMVVWIPEATGLAESSLPPTKATRAKVIASRCWEHDTVAAVNDGAMPAHSNDTGAPRLTWWPNKGTQEWIEYRFERPEMVSSAEVYWFDDSTTQGGCRVPKSWKLLWKKGDQWEPVQAPAGFPVQRDQFNRVTFTPVPTMALRIEVQLQEGMSGGILEWRVP
ncbi:MAG TPA: glycoside hydrolase family 127 protein [Phycisphaerae bacterium]|nr:glycoside hydrolase family 127 protein [Phycisphaerae bacterium]HRY69614.1 glycoside hydrolase family 127 protein [Phycisphaerae bacterium]HSA27271.1 glycoside hydrolase family 127 protein [Phycisphaerae bacterium]